MSPDVTRLQAKLTELRRHDTRFQLFGAATHRYALHSCLLESDVQEVEVRYSITLPEDYRRFLLFMGNGGAGPGYGMYPLDYSLQHSVRNVGLLKAPFPHSERWNMTPEDLGLDRDNDYVAFDKAYFNDTYAQGSLRISTEGCNIYPLLIIAGNERGHIWCDDRSSDGGIYPLSAPHHPDERLSFFGWYELWLDQSLRAYRHDD